MITRPDEVHRRWVRLALVAALATGLAGCSRAPTSLTPSEIIAPPAGTAAGLLSGLEATEFFVVEFQYPGNATWFYAPQLTVRETSGRSTATVTRLSASLPGIGQPPLVRLCSGVSAGQTLSLFKEIYGDFALTFDDPGKRASGTASVNLTFQDADGREGTVTASGPIVPGSLPTTYTGGTASSACAPAR